MLDVTVPGYRITSSLGEGGMARVYLAERESSGDRVALKVSRASVPYARETLANEFEAYKRLEHDCFPAVYDLIEIGDRLVMVMELLEGQTLEQALEDGSEGKALFGDAEKAVELMVRVMDAMTHAGEKGMVHSDLKPANILLNDDRVMIIDFGLATGVTTMTAEDIKEIRGTISYLSPEQADGRPLDIRSDVFSAGVILYETLTGKRPFDSGYDMATIYSIMYEDPTPPSKVNSDLGAIVDRVVMSMLAKEPGDRYPDFSSVRQALEALQGNLTADDSGVGVKVVVAPFQSRGAKEEDTLLAEGLTEELIMALNQLEDVNVPPLVSVQKYQQTGLTPEQARAELGADFLVSGAIRSAAGQVRVTASLIDTQTETIAWNEKFDSPATDLFDLQDTLSAEIFQALKGKLAPDTAAPQVTRGTSNVEAYEYYLKGRSYLTRNTREDMDFARQMLELSIKADEKYSLAYAGMADLHGSMWMNYYDRTDERWNRGVEMALKAVELDPSKPNGYRAHGRLLHLRGRYDEAIPKLERAATLDASYGETYRTLAWACEGKGDLQQSLAWTRKALSVNPHNEEAILLQGILHYDLNNMPQAINAFQRCLELQPDYGRAHYFLAKSYQKMGRFDDAASKYPMAERFGGQPEIVIDYGWFERCRGNHAEAIRLLDKGAREGKLEFIIRYFLGLVLNSAGEADRATQNFRQAVVLSEEIIDKGDTTMYPVLVKALAQAELGDGDLGEALFRRAELQTGGSKNGELALLCARYAARRGMREDAEKWLTMAVTWRLGISTDEARIDPDFADYHLLIDKLAQEVKAA
ncbi:MAG TPA: protein kinase [candidate division Zixibacteria bacterium]|nr:protein kinase [candidate division Zixibacteria bacterium]